MIIFFSGGSPIPEAQIKNPTIMLSYFVNISKRTNGPDSRMRRVLKARKRSIVEGSDNRKKSKKEKK